MRCAHCKYAETVPESCWDYCEVFGDDIPEEHASKDGEGCIYSMRQLEKIIAKNWEKPEGRE